MFKPQRLTGAYVAIVICLLAFSGCEPNYDEVVIKAKLTDLKTELAKLEKKVDTRQSSGAARLSDRDLKELKSLRKQVEELTRTVSAAQAECRQ